MKLKSLKSEQMDVLNVSELSAVLGGDCSKPQPESGNDPDHPGQTDGTKKTEEEVNGEMECRWDADNNWKDPSVISVSRGSDLLLGGALGVSFIGSGGGATFSGGGSLSL